MLKILKLHMGLPLKNKTTSLAVHMPIQKTYVHFHPPPRGGYYTLLSFLGEVYNSASYMGGIYFFNIFISIMFI